MEQAEPINTVMGVTSFEEEEEAELTLRSAKKKRAQV